LVAAVTSHSIDGLREIFGPAIEDLENPDRVQADSELTAFANALTAHKELERQSDNQYELEVGTNSFPFPVPIVKKDGRWFFDTVAGEDEILNRRIGRNELDALESVRAYVSAQREYAGKDRNGDEVLEYAVPPEKRMVSIGQQTLMAKRARSARWWPTPRAKDTLSSKKARIHLANRSTATILRFSLGKAKTLLAANMTTSSTDT
jgi:hypothetical protein